MQQQNKRILMGFDTIEINLVPPNITGLVTLSGGGLGVQERPPCHSLKMSLSARGGDLRQDNFNIYVVFWTVSLRLSEVGQGLSLAIPPKVDPLKI